jgi:hypothetical protein
MLILKSVELFFLLFKFSMLFLKEKKHLEYLQLIGRNERKTNQLLSLNGKEKVVKRY